MVGRVTGGADDDDDDDDDECDARTAIRMKMAAKPPHPMPKMPLSGLRRRDGRYCGG
jgi:hypothetical protein